MNYTFNNSSIVSVNSGTIVLNVSGKTRTFVDAKLVSAVDGEIVLDLPECFVTNGKYIVLDLSLIFIAEALIEEEDAITYYVSQTILGSLDYDDCWSSNRIYRNATPEEIQELDAQLAAEGKRWNPDTMQIEKLRWKPQCGDIYYKIVFHLGKLAIFKWWWSDLTADINSWQVGNCFPTREEAEAKLKQIKKLF